MTQVPPVLHILLGVQNKLNDHIFKFICENIKPDLTVVVDVTSKINL